MRSSLAYFIPLVLLPALAFSAPAQSAPGDAPSAKELYRQAQKLEDAGKLSDALGKYQEAYAALPTPTLLWPIAELCQKLLLPVQGLEALRTYRRQVSLEQAAPGRGAPETERLMQALRAQVARIAVTTDTVGALVLVDDREVGRAPLGGPVEVNPGPHRIEVRGLRTVSRSADVAPGQQAQVMAPTAPEPEPAAPPALTRVAPAIHTVGPREAGQARARGYLPSAPTWIALSLTAGALAGAIGTGVAAGQERDQLFAQCGDPCLEHNGDILTRNAQAAGISTLGRTSIALYATAGALGAVTVVLGIVDHYLWRRRASRRVLVRAF